MTASNDPSPNSSFPRELSHDEPAHDEPRLPTLIVDKDPIFRMGLRAWLEHYPEFEVIEDMEDGAIALQWLQDDLEHSPPAPILILLGGSLQVTRESAPRLYAQLMQWCHDFKMIAPMVMVVIMGVDHPEMMAAAQQAGANGYAYKAGSPEDLLCCFRNVRTGEFAWPDGLMPLSGAREPTREGIEAVIETANESPRNPVTGSWTPPQRPRTRQRGGPFAEFRFRLRLSGVAQIDSQLNQLLPYLHASSSNPHQYVSIVDRWVIAGRCRELRAARWMVTHVLATPSLEALDVDAIARSSPLSQPLDSSTDEQSQFNTTPNPVPVSPTSSADSKGKDLAVGGVLVRWQNRLRVIAQQPIYQATTAQPSSRSGGENASTKMSRRSVSSQAGPRSTMVPSQAEAPVSVRATLFDSLRDRLQSPLLNQTEYPLEIDILREEKKRELLVLILHKILVLLDDLRYSEVQPQQLQERRSQLFYDLWQAILTDYFGKYYVLQVDGIEQEVVTILTQEARAVQDAIFDRIPFAVDVLSHFLFKTPLDIDGVPYSLGTPEAFERAELLLDNLVIQMGNSIVYPLLNHLSDVELIKQNFYQRQLMSSRDIARFRNTLSWHYRRKQWIDDPTHIFESRYTLFTLKGMGIKQTSIYASRRVELDRLSGLPLMVTLLLEFRDALSPRFRGAIAALGSGIIYILTDVIGRAIGLVGRGIIKGIGSAWQDPKQ